MSSHITRHILLQLQNCTDETTAQRLIDRLADPFTRAGVRKQWADLQASQTTYLTTGEPE